MVTRREVLGGAMVGAAAGSLWPRVPAAFAAPGGSDAEAEGVGPLVPSSPAALKRFMGLRYGAFIHWGPASVLGKEISWTREVETPSQEYDNLYKRFNPVEFDAEAWIRMLKDSGFRYVTFVTKHHEGFAMWDTKTTDHNIMNSPFRRDVLKEISAACKKQRFPLCLYYSIADFYQPDCAGASHANGLYLGPPGYSLPPGQTPSFDRYVLYMKAQLKELTEHYGPVVAWWFDGGWQREWTYERGVDLLKYIRSLQADTLMDQRVGCAYNGRVYMPTWFPTDRKYVGDFAVLEVDMPRFNRNIPWEYTTPANGRSYCWTPGPYGEPDTWIDNFVKSACGDGNYLLGLTPPSSGRFDPALVDKLSRSSVWMKRYGESVFETRGGPYKRTNVYGSTCKGNRVYLHVFDQKLSTLTLPPLPDKILGCSLLNGGKSTVTQDANAVTVSINPNDMEGPTTIVVLELAGSAEQIVPIGERPVNRDVAVHSSNKDPASDRLASDGNILTYWKSDGQTKQPWLEYDLGSEKSISRATLFEGAYEGELANIHRFQIDVKSGADWKRIADVTTWGFDTGQEEDFFEWPISVFHPEVRFAPVSAQFVRLKILKAVETPVIHEFELHER
jgi:alpha-L-fucosidase